MSKDVIKLSMKYIDADALCAAREVAVAIALDFFPEIKEYVRVLTIDSIDDDTIENIVYELLRISKEFKEFRGAVDNPCFNAAKMDNHICLAINRKVVRVPVCIEVTSAKPKEPWDPQVEANAYQEMKYVLDNLGDLTDQYADEYAKIVTDEIMEDIHKVKVAQLGAIEYHRTIEPIISKKISHISKTLLREGRDEQREKAVAIVIERNKKYVKYQMASKVKWETIRDLDEEMKEIISELSNSFPGLTAVSEHEFQAQSLVNLGYVKLLSSPEPFGECNNVEKFYEKSGRKLTLIYKPIPR
jgi:hypothetical protein